MGVTRRSNRKKADSVPLHFQNFGKVFISTKRENEKIKKAEELFSWLLRQKKIMEPVRFIYLYITKIKV